jgi:hypothetical protein
MKHNKGSGVFGAWAMALVLGLAFGSPASRAAPPAADVAQTETAPTNIVMGTWQHHKASFSYVGVTTLYTCPGLEGQVGGILRHLGARRDVHVSARGCPGPYNTPSYTALVEADFYTLAPVTGAAGPGTVDARWTPVEVTTRRPYFMGQGDCELIEEMKDFIIQNFSLRDVEYRTDCVPRQYRQDPFSIKGQALTLLPPQSHAAIS